MRMIPDSGLVRWVERLVQDLRHGARLLAKHPGFTLIATLSIAIGVGANAAMFSYADGVILRPLAVPDADNLLAVSATTPTGAVRNDAISYPDFADLRDHARSFHGLTAVRPVVASLAPDAGDVATGRLGFAVSANFFDVLRVRPALGRAFVPDEERVGGAAVAVLAYETWTRDFGADPRVVGREIALGGAPFTVIGVTPEGFTGTSLYLPPAFYVSVATLPTLDGQAAPDLLEQRDVRTLRVFGRLSPGVSLEQANEEVALLARTLQEKYPVTNQGRGLLVRSEMDARLAENAPAAVFGGMVIGLALAVLLVACANVAQLLTSRAPAREREIAVRMAIGGSRARLVRQLITESALLATIGGAVGLLLAGIGIRSLQQLQYANDSGVRLTFELDGRALAVGLGIAALSALLSSAIPAWRSTRLRDLSRALRHTTGPHLRMTRLWGRHGLVALQIALTLILLTVALSFYRAFEAEYRDGPGFRTEHLLLTALDPGFARYDQRQSDAFYERLKARAAAIPNVTSVAVTSFVPLSPSDGSNAVALVPESADLPPGVDSYSVAGARVDEGYFDTFGIPIVSGRGIRVTDTANAPRVAVVSRGMAARFWPGADPVGRRIRLLAPNGGLVEVIGVAADVKFAHLVPASTPFLYLSWLQFPSTRATLGLRTEADSAAAADPVRAAISEIDRAVPIIGMHTIEAFYDANARNLNAVLVRTIAAMGTMGLLLALSGLYGLAAYVVSRRTREIGIRMALGALPPSMLIMILRQGMIPSVAGLALGMLASAAVGGLVQGTFPGTGTDAVTFLLIVPVVALVVMLATYIPARRAARIDPLAALRQE